MLDVIPTVLPAFQQSILLFAYQLIFLALIAYVLRFKNGFG